MICRPVSADDDDDDETQQGILRLRWSFTHLLGQGRDKPCGVGRSNNKPKFSGSENNNVLGASPISFRPQVPHATQASHLTPTTVTLRGHFSSRSLTYIYCTPASMPHYNISPANPSSPLSLLPPSTPILLPRSHLKSHGELCLPRWLISSSLSTR